MNPIQSIRHLKSPFAPKLIKFSLVNGQQIDENYIKPVLNDKVNQDVQSIEEYDSSKFVDTNIVMQTEPTGDVSSVDHDTNETTVETIATSTNKSDSTTVSMVIPVKSFDRL